MNDLFDERVNHMKEYVLEKEKELLESAFLSDNKNDGKIKSDIVNATLKELEKFDDEDK